MIGAGINLRPLQLAFLDVKRRAENWRKPFEQSGQAVLKEFEARWAQHGPGWPPNAKGSTALYKSGRLCKSFTRRGAPGNLWKVTSREAQFGSLVSYASALNTGGAITLPGGAAAVITARELVRPPSLELKDKIGQFATAHFQKLAGTR